MGCRGARTASCLRMRAIGVETVLQLVPIRACHALISVLVRPEVLACLRLHDEVVLDALERVAVVADVEASLELIESVGGTVVAGPLLAHLIVEMDSLGIIGAFKSAGDASGGDCLLKEAAELVQGLRALVAAD